jgi:hypothetical protein
VRKSLVTESYILIDTSSSKEQILDSTSTPNGPFSGFSLLEDFAGLERSLDLTLSVFYFQNANDMVLKSPINALKESKVRIFIDLFSVL